MGGRAAVVGVMLHVPQVTELMFRAAGGAAGLGGLHGEAAEHHAFDEFLDGFRLACEDTGGIGDHFRETTLHDVPSLCVNEFGAECIGNDPVGAGGDFGEQVGV